MQSLSHDIERLTGECSGMIIENKSGEIYSSATEYFYAVWHST